MSAWFSPASIVALVVTLVFAVIALRRPTRGVIAYALLGAAPPIIQLGAFSGRTISQGLLLAETLASVLTLAWLFRRRAETRATAPFEVPLLAFAVSAFASFLGTILLPDYRVAADTSMTVSVGQLLLIAWPIGVYFASATFIRDAAQLRFLQRAIIALAAFQAVIPVLPDALRPHMVWATTFGVFATPFAIAAAFAARSLPVRLVLLALALAPFARGILTGKAFLYVYVLTSAGTIVWLRASRAGALAAGLAGVILIGTVGVVGEEALLRPVRTLVDKERAQMSVGGRTGRGQITLDSLEIWQSAPIFGVGPANSYAHLLRHNQVGTPHSQYLNILVEFGILGLVTWAAFLAMALRTGLELYRRVRTPELRTFVLGWLGMFVGFVFAGFTGDFMVHSVRNGGLELFSGYYLQWVFLGGLTAVRRLESAGAAQPAAARATPAGRPIRRLVPRRAAARGAGVPAHG